MGDSRRDANMRRVFSFNIDNLNDAQAHSPSYDPTVNFFNPAISPDGNFIVYVALGEYFKSLVIAPVSNQQVGISQITPFDQQQCEYQSPTWLPDGSGLVFASSCSGKFAIYRADLRVNGIDPAGYGVGAELVNIRAIAQSPNYDNFFPRVSPDGTKVVFASNRDGNNEIYVVNIDGSNQQRITNKPADDSAATWGYNSAELVFDSNRDGDYELYALALRDPARITQLTNNTVDDRWPAWHQ